MPILAKKNHLFRWSSFWSWHFDLSWGTENRTHTLKSRHTQNCCRFWSRGKILHFSSKMTKEKPLQSMAIVIGLCWTNFCPQKLKRRILATFGFNRTALRATQPKLHSDVLRPVSPPRSCVKDKCYADKPETIDALKDNIPEAIDEIQMHGRIVLSNKKKKFEKIFCCFF